MSGLADYSSVTEVWGTEASPDQLAMARARYRLAARIGQGRRVLEIGCGTGFGLHHVARTAALVVGADATAANLTIAAERSAGALRLTQCDAHALPFAAGSFDVLLLLEMIYYLRDVDRALVECRRVLGPGGQIVVSMANKERPGFHPSPFATRYLSAGELASCLERAGFSASLLGGFPVAGGGLPGRMMLQMRKMAVALGLVPRTLAGRAAIKRLLYGKLPRLDRIEDGPETPLVPIDPASRQTDWMNIYAVATIR